MKKIKTENEIDFLILGVNSHVKSYKLCWEINKKLQTNFIKKENHIHPENNKITFNRFFYKDEKNGTNYNLISNRSELGYLDLNNKSVNFYLIVDGGIYKSKNIIEKLNQIDDVLLAFELDLKQIKSITPFLIND